jgi:hypoxanthine phosphoribosyltransferase
MIELAKIKALQDKAVCLHDTKSLHAALDRMACEIEAVLKETNPLILAAMNGSMIPTAGLMTRMSFPMQLDYIHVTRYQGKVRAGDLHWLVESRTSLQGRTVLIVEDILDGGLTMAAIVDYCKQQGAEKVYTATVVDKKRERDPGGTLQADFTGLYIEDLFLFGYGLDYEGYFRNLDGIYALMEPLDDDV